jgi:peptidoglycan/LPS O-acetylase OafA/YrhL
LESPVDSWGVSTTAHSPPRAYRPDIDGLRAVAVACVVAYHNFPFTVHGGFVGVDIFFVISGFLITSLITEDMDRGRFLFASFYARRVRRIFPALAVVLAFCLAVGAVLFDVGEFHELGLQVAAGAGFLSNVLLWSEAGYFDEAAVFKPLLHLWSLAVEEQFYIVWPLALFLCARFRRPFWPLALAFAGASFALNLYLSKVDDVADFYFIFSRIWELLIGALLAVTIPSALHDRTRLANVAATMGVALIVAGLLLIDSTQLFPSWRALAPTLGAVLIIAAGPHAFLNARLLSNRLMVAIGKISYPLYLWHWPLLVFARFDAAGGIGPPLRWALIATAVALSQATYLYVETPIRLGPGRGKRTALAVAAIAALGLIGLRDFRVGGLLFPAAPLANVANEGGIGLFEFHEYFMAHSAPCDTKTFPPFAGHRADPFRCGQSIAGVAPEVVILGDSHAQHVFLGLAEALPKRNVAFLGGGLPSSDSPFSASIYAALGAEPRVKVVILSAAWKNWIERQANGAILRDKLDRAVHFLRAAGKDVYILNDIPSFAFRAERCKFAGGFRAANLCDEDESALERQLGLYAGDLAAVVAANPGARLIDTAHMFCSGAVCSMAADGKLLYRDDNHLNINGSRFLGAKIVAAAPELGD